MFPFENDAMLVQDREDLIALLRIRFGSPPPKVIEVIYEIDQLDTLERLILTAANAPRFGIFLEELQAGNDSFKILGERFNPIEDSSDKGGSNGSEG